ncbi:MFS transporter [Tichowtungia aerotolerans]|uniref:MFS transporter n=1 Tax=Tichowtungia aerotolerans TaxID=2697043 RepID=A0A6P1M9H4_9BACT|nr:MFS transporter [Tichowtungia aerotolerans]QHI70682.1 MFS transporter [Tichowtungia aerotolerans]
MMQKHSVHKAVPKDRVPMSVRIGWGCGGVADNFIMNVLNMIFLVLYVQYFKMPPVLAGAALAIPRFVDAVTDPMIGNLSDNTRSRWGRRRPYMMAGAILSAVLLPLFWLPPSGAENPVWYQNPAFIFATVLGVVFAVTYTLFVVPYTALGYELTPDYDEKTRVLAWRMYIGLLASLTVPWAYKLCQLDTFPNEAVGAVWVSIGFGIVIIITGLIPVLVCREREDVQKQETSPFLQATKATLTNKAFLVLLVAYIIIIVGLFSAANLGAFVNIYYICGGNKDFGGLLVAVAGSLGAIISYFSMFLVTAVSVRTGKKTGMILGLILALLGVIGAWFAMDPRWPLAQLLTTVVACMGLQGCWLMVSSMVADICDEDELKTGLRREGMFGAINGFALKAALSFTALIGGWLLSYSGFDAEQIDQFEARTIAEVIEPARELNLGGAAFEKAGRRFVEISDDKSSMEGSKWTSLWRLLKGEKVFFRWYDFEDAVNTMLAGIPAAQTPELKAYVETVQDGFLTDFAEQKRVALLMKKLVIGFQAAGLMIAIIIFAFYPITRERAEETRRKLDERKSHETNG